MREAFLGVVLLCLGVLGSLPSWGLEDASCIASVYVMRAPEWVPRPWPSWGSMGEEWNFFVTVNNVETQIAGRGHLEYREPDASLFPMKVFEMTFAPYIDLNITARVVEDDPVYDDIGETQTTSHKVCPKDCGFDVVPLDVWVYGDGTYAIWRLTFGISIRPHHETPYPSSKAQPR